MTDFDELASAYLDDAVTADERRHVDGDPALRARVDELRHARDAVAAAPVPPPDPTVRAAAIRVALDAGNVVVLDRDRARRRLRLVSIAAAAVVAIGLAGLLLHARSDDTANTASRDAAPPPAVAASASAQSRAASPGQPQTFTTASALGSFSNRDDLVAAVKTAVTTPRTTGAPADSAVAPSGAATGTVPVCTTVPPGATQTLLSSTAVLAGDAVQLDVYALSDGTRRLVVTERLSCTEVFSQTL